MKYVHTNIITLNWRRLADFYTSVFNCEIVPPIRDQKGKWLDKATGVEDAHITGAHLRLPGYNNNGPTLEIYEYDDVKTTAKPVPNQQGFGHIAFEVEDVNEVIEQLLLHGGNSLGEISSKKVEGVGVITVVYARDPDGNIIELQNWQKE